MDALSLKVRPWMRFNPPKDQVIDFLRAKITGNDELVNFIPEVQCCKWEPWDLKVWLDSRWIKTAYPEWWFFSRLDLKHRSGNRSNRATNAGFWKVTGKDKIIMSELGMIGKKKYLVFYIGRGKGEKTNWKMHEYHITQKDLDGTHPGQNAYVLCRLFYEQEKCITDPNINDAGPAVSSPAISKLFHEESESELLLGLLASVFPASAVETTTTPENCDETISGTTTVVKCDDKHISAHAAENQLGELTIFNDDLEIEKTIIELQQTVGGDALKPSTSLHNNPTVSSVTTAKSYLEELESTLGLDVVSPQECFDGKTLNTIQLSRCDQNSYNAFNARNEVPKATVSEVDFGFEDGFSLFELSSEPPDGVYDLATYGHEFQELDYLNGNVPNMFGSQKNLTLESIKDNESCGSLDAKLANAPFESTFQDSVEISKRKASSGLQNLGSHMSAFVHCCLFKKQDESIEASNGVEAEPVVSSSTTAKCSPEGTPSEVALDPVSPSLGGQSENHPASIDYCPDKKSNGTISDTFIPVNHNSSSYGAERNVVESPVSELLECLNKMLDEQQMELLDGTIPSPLHTQAKNELGSSFTDYPNLTNLENSHSGVQFQYGLNEPYDFDPMFLDPFLNAPYGSPYLAAVSLSDLANEGQSPMNMEPIQPQIQLSVENFVQGTAPRRFRLQCKLHVRSCSLKPTTTEEGKTSEKRVLPDDPGDDANTTSTLSELQRILSDSIDNSKTSQEPSTGRRASLKSQGNTLRPPVRPSIWPFAIMFRVAMFVVLFIIFASVWKCIRF